MCSKCEIQAYIIKFMKRFKPFVLKYFHMSNHKELGIDNLKCLETHTQQRLHCRCKVPDQQEAETREGLGIHFIGS